jgi:hypothetical protein
MANAPAIARRLRRMLTNSRQWRPAALFGGAVGCFASGAYSAAAPAVCSVERSSFTPGPIVDETEARRR